MNFTPLIITGTIFLISLSIFFLSCSLKNFLYSQEYEDFNNYKRLRGKYEKENS